MLLTTELPSHILKSLSLDAKPTEYLSVLPSKKQPFRTGFGGQFYVPKGWVAPPKLIPFIQLNLSHLQTVLKSPKLTGILQLWVPPQDITWGAIGTMLTIPEELENEPPIQSQPKAVFFHFPEDSNWIPYIHKTELRHDPTGDQFAAGVDFIPYASDPYDLPNCFSRNWLPFQLERSIEHYIESNKMDLTNRYGNKFGGYVHTTQDLPTELVPTINLLQIASDGPFLWGDSGIAHILIQPDDLASGKFEHAIWYWDCL